MPLKTKYKACKIRELMQYHGLTASKSLSIIWVLGNPTSVMLQRTFYTNFKHYFLSFHQTHELTQNSLFDSFGGLGILFAAKHCLTVNYTA